MATTDKRLLDDVLLINHSFGSGAAPLIDCLITLLITSLITFLITGCKKSRKFNVFYTYRW